MATILRALFVTMDSSLPDALSEQMKADFELLASKISKSTREGIQEMIAAPYDVCFVSEEFESGDLQSLVRDVTQLPLAHRGVVVRIVATLDAKYDRLSQQGAGIGAVIAREFGDGDRNALMAAMRPRIEAQQREALAPEMESATSTMLRELDFAASEKKRGRIWNLKSLARNIIVQHISATQEVRNMFYEILAKLTGESKSFPDGKLDVPPELLARQPPGLESDTYTGPSKRVWQRLHKRFGKQNRK